MAKDTIFFCSECGNEFQKWSGQCPSCKAWNTLIEAPKKKPVIANVKTAVIKDKNKILPLSFDNITENTEERILTGMPEFDRVLGGGIVKGALMLIGGDPGIGKSTLLTQVCKSLTDAGRYVLYVSGEESPSQIKMRAKRIGKFSEKMKILCETDLDAVAETVQKEKPDVLIIDSIQTVFCPDIQGTPGSITQVRESTNVLLQLSKGCGISTFVVGHVTKDGTVAGPRTLEHMVDTVLYFEGDSNGIYRILRGVKNRFGATNEIGVFEMCSTGLKEVKNPSEYLLADRPENASGSVVSCSMEGTRPILGEIQALVTKTSLANPRRSAIGVDYNRLNLLIAVIAKSLKMDMSGVDIYVSLVGGNKVTEPAFDAAIISAILSSAYEFPLPDNMMVIGEVGLSGEIRNVSQIETRVKEAKKLGYTKCIIPQTSAKILNDTDVVGVKNVNELFTLLKENK